MACEEQLLEADHKMEMAVTATREDFAAIRTGRASPQLLDRVHVDYYGTKTPLNQLAGISVPEARLMVVSPFDKNALGAIEKAIQTSDIGINPSSDGNVIRLVIPELTEERRRQYVRQMKERAEEGRVAIRNVRRHTKDEMGRLAGGGEVSEDELRRAEKELQELTDRHVGEIDALAHKKEQELLEV